MSLTHEEMLFTLGVVDAGFLSAAGGDATLTDATKNWPTNGLAGMAVRVFSGTGNGQWRVVASNTATVITVASNWGTNPVAGDRYVILATGSSTVSMAAAAASLAVLDDWDATHDGAAPADGVQVMAAYDSTLPTAVTDADAVRVLADAYGRLRVGFETDRIGKTVTSADASAGVLFEIAAAAKKIALINVVISCGALMTVTLEDADGGDLLVVYVGANGGANVTFNPAAPRCITTANKDLKLTTSAAGNVSVTVTGYYYA